jgi:hypothetical protein
MTGRFVDLMAAADYLGPGAGAVEVNRYQTEIFDIVRRRGAFGQRIKQVPATGHPSRRDGNCGSDGGAGVHGPTQHRSDAASTDTS